MIAYDHASSPQSFPVVWRRNARARRIVLRIDAQAGGVVVTLPVRASRAAGEALLQKNAGWVATRLAALPAVAGFADGVSVSIDGVPHVICHVPEGRGTWLEPGRLNVAGSQAFLTRRVRDFLRAEAKRRFADQASVKAAQAGVAVGRVTVKDVKSRWGSCSPKAVLMFSWRLLMAPLFVQDYVIAHEVAHIRHLNHGAAFWALADTLSPHRAAAETWLEREGPRLLRVG